jgi:hypothetical protein
MTEMELGEEENSETVVLLKKFRKSLPDEECFLSLFATLLGAADNISQYILEQERGNYLNLPVKCKYGLLQVYQILNVTSAILRDEVKPDEIKVAGYFPTGDGAWKSEVDFEKRLILMVKLFYKNYKDLGKI